MLERRDWDCNLILSEYPFVPFRSRHLSVQSMSVSESCQYPAQSVEAVSSIYGGPDLLKSISACTMSLKPSFR